MKYKFQSLYELDSLAVVNARDVGPCKNAFKILMFPDTRMFQADNPKTKVFLPEFSVSKFNQSQVMLVIMLCVTLQHVSHH